VRIQGWTADRPTRQVEIKSCGAARQVYPGGLLFPPPRRCIEVTAEADGRTATVEVGAGRSC
jgi:hypothetical protein